MRGQAFDAFKLLIASVVAGAILVILLSIIGGVNGLLPVDTTKFDVQKVTISDLKVEPSSGPLGTAFLVSVTAKNIIKEGVTQCYAPPIIEADIGGVRVEMFDDGKHEDGKRRDCVFVGIYDSLLSNIGEKKTFVYLEDARGLSKESDSISLEVTKSECVSVHGNGDDKNLDIVFVGDSYNDPTQFATDVKIHSRFLLSITPFDEYAENINVWFVSGAPKLGCVVEGGYINCDDTQVEQFASQCPHDEIIVLVNTPKTAGTANPNAYASRLYPEITLHEFGHSFGPNPINLADEYSYQTSVAYGNQIGDPANCDVAGCPKWQDAECVNQDKYGAIGCSYSEWYKYQSFNEKTGVSIMEGANVPDRRVLTENTKLMTVGFNKPSIQHLRSLLEEYK